MNNKRQFKQASLVYCIIIGLFSLAFFLFYPEVSNDSMGYYLTFYVAMMFLFNLGYFFFLQRNVRNIRWISITSVSAVCCMGGLGLGIIVLLLLGVSKSLPLLFLVFALIYMALPVWIGHWRWMVKTKD